MPKRSNDFQRLVKLVQQALAPRGAKVRESVLIDSAGTMREIDVLVEGEFGMYHLKIAVEAKDQSRALDVNAIEQIASKYRPGDGITVNQVVIVSKSGFSKAAAAKAKRSNIELLTLREAESRDWAGCAPASAKHILHFRIAPHLHRVRISPSPSVDEQRFALEGRCICRGCGKDHGTLRAAAQRIVTRLQQNAEFQKQSTDAMRSHRGNLLVTMRTSFNNRLIRFRDELYRAEEIELDLHLIDAVAPLEIRTYEQLDSGGGRRVVQHAVAEVAGRRVQMLIPDGLSSKQIVIDVASVDKEDCCDSNSGKAA